MQAGKRYSFWASLRWTRKYVVVFILWAALPVSLYQLLGWSWLAIPWQPISLIGIAVAFYLGFKNNSSYDRLWEARKIWGGIVNASRSFTVMVKNFVNNDEAEVSRSEEELSEIKKRLVHRHVAWLRCLALELRKLKAWEHQSATDKYMRQLAGTEFTNEGYEQLKPYLSTEDFEYVMSKGNRSSHLLSSQTSDMMRLRQEGVIEHFRHLEMQSMITEFYALQGKSERIKNFPFPRQYASANYYYVILFIFLLPFGMLDVFSELGGRGWIWASIPFTVIASWVFWFMELIGDYSENPFEGLYNDVPIASMARGIEIDIRQMLDETDLPEPMKPVGDMELLV